MYTYWMSIEPPCCFTCTLPLKLEIGDLGGAILFGGTGLDIGERGTGERGVGDGETEERGVGEGRGMEVRAVGPDDGGFYVYVCV